MLSFEHKQNIINKITKQLTSRTSLPVEDIVQEGWIGVLKAERTYDPSKGHSEEGWASWLVHNAIIDTINRYDRIPLSRLQEDFDVADQRIDVEAETDLNNFHKKA